MYNKPAKKNNNIRLMAGSCHGGSPDGLRNKNPKRPAVE